MVRFIIINGTGGSGKDTFVELFEQRMKMDPCTKDFEVINYSTIDFEKRIMRIVGRHYKSVFKAIRDKRDSYRNCLSELKQRIEEEFPISSYEIARLFDSVANPEKKWNGYIFIHCREPENIHKIMSQLYDHITDLEIPTDVKVISLLVSGRVDPAKYSNPSDKNVDNFTYDYRIDNSGDMDTLSTLAQKFYDNVSC